MIGKKIFYNLQICRGIAAFIVLLAHANLMVGKNLFSGFFVIGWNGVDFFFVLSGFIVYYVNFRSIGQPNKFRDYIQKRLIRIYPIYWLYTILAIALDFALLRFTGNHIINWFDYSTLNIIKSFFLYPTNTAANEMPIIPVAWTLSFEILFYIIFGICILANKRFYVYIVGLWLIGIILNNFNIIDTSNNYFLQTLFNNKNIEFIFGCIIAQLALRDSVIRNYFIAIIVLSLGILLLSISWINEYQNFRFFSKMDVINFGIPYSIIIYALISLESSNVKTKAKRVLVYLGDASYSIYLTHFIGIICLKSILLKITDNGYVQFTFIIIALTIFGCLCYSYIEKPLLKVINNWFTKTNTNLASVLK